MPDGAMQYHNEMKYHNIDYMESYIIHERYAWRMELDGLSTNFCGRAKECRKVGKGNSFIGCIEGIFYFSGLRDFEFLRLLIMKEMDLRRRVREIASCQATPSRPQYRTN